MSLLFIQTQIWPTKLEDWEFQPNSEQLKIICKPPDTGKQTYLDAQSAKPQNWRGAFSLAANKAPALETRSTALPTATVHSSTQQIYLSHPISSHPPVSKSLCSLLASCFSQWAPLPQPFPHFWDLHGGVNLSLLQQFIYNHVISFPSSPISWLENWIE